MRYCSNKYIIQVHNYSLVILVMIAFTVEQYSYIVYVPYKSCFKIAKREKHVNYEATFLTAHLRYIINVKFVLLLRFRCLMWTVARKEMGTKLPTTLWMNQASGNTDMSPLCEWCKCLWVGPNLHSTLKPYCFAFWRLKRGGKTDWVCPDKKPDAVLLVEAGGRGDMCRTFILFSACI